METPAFSDLFILWSVKGEINSEQDVIDEISNTLGKVVIARTNKPQDNATTPQTTPEVVTTQQQQPVAETPTPSEAPPVETPATPVIGENPEMQGEAVPESKPETPPSSVNEITQQMPEPDINYAVMNNGVPIYADENKVVPGKSKDYSYTVENGERHFLHGLEEEEKERNYLVRNNGVPIYSNDGYTVPGRLKDYSYGMVNGKRTIIHEPGEINETNSVQINPSKKTTQTREQPVEEPDRNYVVANNSVPYYENTPGEGIDAYSPDRRDYSYGYENGERRVVNPPGEINESNSTTTVRPVDRGRFDYIRNNGWGSNSSILTRMGYSQDEIRRILDSTGAVRPEYFSY